MVGQITYTEDQILFILRLTLQKDKGDMIRQKYEKRFNKPLTAAQLRYVKQKYGHDPEFGTALVNGTVPESGGNRKTAAPSPKQQVAQVQTNRTTPNTLANTSIRGASKLSQNLDCAPAEKPCQYPVAPNEDDLLRLLALSTSPFPPSVDTFPAELQQNTWSQADRSAAQTEHDESHFTEPSKSEVTSEPVQEPPTNTSAAPQPVFDANNPYGFQSVLQHYNASSQMTRTLKRKREEPVAQDQAAAVSPIPQAHLHDLSEAQDNDSKRLKLESPEVSTEVSIPEQSSTQTSNTSLNRPATPQATHIDAQVDEPLSPLTKLLRDFDAGVYAEQNTGMLTPPSPPSLQQEYLSPAGYDLSGYNPSEQGTVPSAGVFLNSASDVVDAPSISSMPSLTFSTAGTTPSWSPLWDSPGATLWSGVAPLSSSSLSMPTWVAADPTMDPLLDPSLDPSLASFTDAAFLSVLDVGQGSELEPYHEQLNQQPNAEEPGTVAPAALPQDLGADMLTLGSDPSTFADEFTDFDWQLLLQDGGEGVAANDWH